MQVKQGSHVWVTDTSCLNIFATGCCTEWYYQGIHQENYFICVFTIPVTLESYFLGLVFLQVTNLQMFIFSP